MRRLRLHQRLQLKAAVRGKTTLNDFTACSPASGAGIRFEKGVLVERQEANAA
jgi:hypothetical protein